MNPDKELQGKSRLLAYEWHMLHECHRLLTGTGPKPQVVRNALVESRLLHTRSLIEFFFWKPQSDDVSLSSWFAEGSAEFRCFRGFAHKSDLKTEKKNIDKRLAHLTEKRIGEIVRAWDPVHIRWLNKLMLKFVELARDRVDPTLHDLAAKYQNRTVSDIVYGTSGNPGEVRRVDFGALGDS